MNPRLPQKISERVSVVIPVHNEAGNIAPLYSEIEQAISGLGDWEVVFADDGSDDAGVSELESLCRSEPRCRVIRLASCSGQSTAVWLGVRSATGDWIVTLDGDGQNDPADIPALLAMAKNAGNERILIIGHRQLRHDTWSRRLSSRVANAVRSSLLQDSTPDSGCGLKVFRRDVFLTLPYFDHMHRFIPALIIRSGGTVKSVPVNHRPRLEGKSKYGIHNRLWVGIADLLGVRWLTRRSVNPNFHELPGTGTAGKPDPAPAKPENS